MVRLCALLCSFVCAFALAAPAASAAPPPSPWLQTDGDAAASGNNPAESTLSVSAAPKLRQLRTIAADPSYNGCDGGVTATAISENRLYVIVDNQLRAYNLTSGALLWRATNPPTTNFQAVEDHIAVSHGRVLISGIECGSNDPFSYIQSFDSATGKPLWNHTYGDGLRAFEVSGSYVVAHVPSTIESDPSTTVYNVLDGSTVWTCTAACQTAAHVVAQLVFVYPCVDGNSSGTQALHLATGKPAWNTYDSYPYLNGDTDTAAAKHVYAGTGIHVYDLDPATGAVRFVLNGASTLIATDGTRTYAQCQNGYVCGYDAATGKGLWRSSLTEADHGIVADGVLYLDGGYELNAATGRQIGRLPKSTIGVDPVAVGSAHVAGVDGTGTLHLYGL